MGEGEGTGQERSLRVVFLIVGEGPLRGPLEELATRLGIRQHVHFEGAVRQPAIAAVYAAMDVFVMPSLMPSETFGIVLIEAMSQAVPVVTFGVFGQTEVVIDHPDIIDHPTNVRSCAAAAACPREDIPRRGNGNALVVRVASPAALAEAVVRLLQNSTLRLAVGARARRTVLERFSSRRNGQAMAAVYRALMRR